MRTTISLTGVLIVAAVAAVLVRGQPDRPADPGKAARTITVTGTGTATAKPDTVRVHLGVSSFARTVAEARAQNVAAVKKVQAAIAALNLPDPKTRTTDTQVVARTAKDDHVTLVGYDVTQSFTVRLTDPDPEKLASLAEKVLDAGLGNGANMQGRVEFFLADDAAIRRQAMQAAVEDALAGAKAYAAGAKLTVADVASIEEPQHTWFGGGVNPGLSNNVQVAPAADGGTLAAGNWSVTSSVRVVCRY